MEDYVFRTHEKMFPSKVATLIKKLHSEFPGVEVLIKNEDKLTVKLRPNFKNLNRLLKLLSSFGIKIDMQHIEVFENGNYLLLKCYNKLPQIDETANPLYKQVFSKSLSLLYRVLNAGKFMIASENDRNIHKEKLCLPCQTENENPEYITLDLSRRRKDLETVEIHLFFLKCSSCTNKLENILSMVEGVDKVAVDYFTKIAYVTFNQTLTDTKKILGRIKAANYDGVIASTKQKETSTAYFKYRGRKINLNSLKINYPFLVESLHSTKTWHFLKVSYSKKQVGIRRIYDNLQTQLNGVKLSDFNEVYPTEGPQETLFWRKMFLISFIFGLISMLVMIADMCEPFLASFLLLPGLSYSNMVLFMSSTFVQFFVGKTLYTSAYRSLFFGLNMDFLICTATSISYLYSCVILAVFMARKTTHSPHTFFETPPMLYMIVCFGRWLEHKSQQHTISSLKALMGPKNYTVAVIHCDEDTKTQIIKFDSTLLQENDILQVSHGMCLPCDGIITKLDGCALLNEAMITGESFPVEKHELDEVYSGSINEGTLFRMKVTRTGDDCRIQTIYSCIQRALSKKIKISNLVNKVSRYFTPVLWIMSLLTFGIWTTLFHYLPHLSQLLNIESSLQFSFQAAISVLCAACPCAIGLTIPLAVMISTGIGAKQGIFIKGGPPIQVLCGVDKVVFDKTGTLTTGKSEVESFVSFTHQSDSSSIEHIDYRVIYSLVQGSVHVFSRAIQHYFEEKFSSIETVDISQFEELPGFGLVGMKGKNCENHVLYLLGKEEMLLSKGISIPPGIKEALVPALNEGASVVFVGRDRAFIGYFIVRDKIRPDAEYTIRSLKALNIKTVMLTGDRKETASYVAQKLGIDEYFSNMTPIQKSSIVGELMEEGATVAMVGDGINDTIALARSAVGIAIGSNADMAVETANVVLMGNKLYSLLNLIVLSRQTMRTIKGNLVFSLVYNLMSVPIAAGGLKWTGLDVQPWAASIAMVLSSLSVIASSMTLLLFKPPYDGINSP